MTITSEVKRPALRYHGGKWLLAPWIISFFPEHTTYVEPYGGAMSVLLRKPRSYAEIYNDLDGEIVNVFKQARDNGAELQKLLRLTPFSREDFKEAYLPTDDLLERTRRTIARSFMGFGSDSIKNVSGFRANSNRSGTTPAHDWANYSQVFEALVNRLQGVVLENRPAFEVIVAHDSEKTLHYIDPPYVHSTRSAKQPKQYRHEMSDADHEALANLLGGVKGKVIVSGYDSLLYRELYRDWHMEEKAALADGARPRKEVLWLNFKPKTLL